MKYLVVLALCKRVISLYYNLIVFNFFSHMLNICFKGEGNLGAKVGISLEEESVVSLMILRAASAPRVRETVTLMLAVLGILSVAGTIVENITEMPRLQMTAVPEQQPIPFMEAKLEVFPPDHLDCLDRVPLDSGGSSTRLVANQ